MVEVVPSATIVKQVEDIVNPLHCCELGQRTTLKNLFIGCLFQFKCLVLFIWLTLKDQYEISLIKNSRTICLQSSFLRKCDADARGELFN